MKNKTGKAAKKLGLVKPHTRKDKAASRAFAKLCAAAETDPEVMRKHLERVAKLQSTYDSLNGQAGPEVDQQASQQLPE
jgi:hypothetical protein